MGRRTLGQAFTNKKVFIQTTKRISCEQSKVFISLNNNKTNFIRTKKSFHLIKQQNEFHSNNENSSILTTTMSKSKHISVFLVAGEIPFIIKRLHRGARSCQIRQSITWTSFADCDRFGEVSHLCILINWKCAKVVSFKLNCSKCQKIIDKLWYV